MRRLWQSAMISLARSPSVKRWVQSSRGGSLLSTRYVAGESAASGVARAQLLAEEGIRSSLFYLGEYVDTLALVRDNVEAKMEAADRLAQAGLDIHISVDPTQVGHQIDRNLARDNLFAIAEVVARASAGRDGVHALMLDMEDASVVDATIAVHEQLRAAGLPAALTLQAYLRRTEEDLRRIIRCGGRVRLVKGAFASGRALAFTRNSEIKANSRRLIELMLSRQARDSGFYPSIATHDTALQAFAMERADASGWKTEEYEFEMLLGVRGEAARTLARARQRVRLYVPFGSDWWPHAVRRIGENPRNASLLVRSLLSSSGR